MTTTCITSFATLALLITSPTSAFAAVFQINGIAPFDTNLGTLTHATVSLDPVPVQTSTYDTGFNSISSHIHTVFAPPANVAGFDTFAFAAVPTSPASSGPFSSHSHSVDLIASVKNYSGAGLNWFLNAANAPINSVVIPTFNTTMSESHIHTVQLLPIVPRTTYTYTPAAIPEPTTLGLITLGGLALILPRKRSA